MKKLSITIITLILFVSLIGCQRKTEISSMDVAKSISDIYTDPEGNVTIQLLDGRNFYLGNMKGPQGERGLQGEKGEKGDKGDTGPQGIQGPQGPAGASGSDGRNGANGIDGKNGVDGKDGEIPTDYVKEIELRDDRYLYSINGDGSEDYIARLSYNAKYKIYRRYHYGDIVIVDDQGKDPSYTHFNEGGTGSVSATFYGHYTDDDLKTTTYELVKAECEDADVSEGIVSEYGYVEFTLSNLPGKDVYIDFYYEKTEQEEDLKITFPSDGASLQEIKQFANKYTFITWGTTFGAGIENDYFEIINSNDGSVIPNGSTVTFSPYSGTTYHIVYHKKHYANVSYQNSSTSEKALSLITYYDLSSEFVKWEYTNNIEGLIIENTETPNIINLKTETENVNGSIKITGKTNNESAYAILTITNGIIKMTDNSEW